jgi:hypothetical protein
LFNPHHVNQGGVQTSTPQVTLYESYTTLMKSLSGDVEVTDTGDVWSCESSEGTLARVVPPHRGSLMGKRKTTPVSYSTTVHNQISDFMGEIPLVVVHTVSPSVPYN